MKKILLLCGGGGEEHAISVLSANYIQQSLPPNKYQVTRQELADDSQLAALLAQIDQTKIDYIIPCFHGYPGETGDIQTILELMNIPYLGCNSEASKICFNKITTKLWFDLLDIPNTPYLFLTSMEEAKKAKEALAKWNTIFVKASSQGSSVGCYRVNAENQNMLEQYLAEAFELSPYVLIEQGLSARELEIAVYQYNNEIIATKPGEIIYPTNSFYSYQEKYSNSSKTQTLIEAPNLKEETTNLLMNYADKAFRALKLRHLSRVDFFLTADNQIYMNEINTFPGMTPISMFPKMMENNGTNFSDFLQNIID